jgi:hypothetical protein
MVGIDLERGRWRIERPGRAFPLEHRLLQADERVVLEMPVRIVPVRGHQPIADREARVSQQARHERRARTMHPGDRHRHAHRDGFLPGNSR